jgi:tetratricopeptide (TPR) repeat protein
MKSISSIQALIEAQQYIQAEQALSKLIAQNPNTQLFYLRAKCYYRLERFEDAIADYDRLLSQQPSADGFYERGLAKYMAGRSIESLEDFDRAVELDPDYAFRYASRGFIKAALGMVEAAIEDYQKAIELDPDDAINHNNLGLLYEQLGMPEAAIKHFRKADAIAGLPEGKYISQQHPRNPQFINIPNEATPTATNRWQIIKEVFCSAKRRKEFFRFVAQKLGLGKKETKA